MEAGEEVPVQGEDLMDNISIQSKESDLDEESQGWQTSKRKRAKKTKKKQVVMATRTSTRIPRDGISIAEKATNRSMAKDNLSGTASHNHFTIFNNTSTSILQSVMIDLGLV